MKPRPIIFSSEMVRAILADKKTQTRRVVKAYPNCHIEIVEGVAEMVNTESPEARIFLNHSPYGVVGDRLWVREGYRQELNLGHDKNGNWPDAKSLYSYFYKADCDNPKGWGIGVWKSPMFMPRAASRIELEITGIRVERLLDIDDADATAEGVGFSSIGGGNCPRENYCGLWEKINGKKHPWESNPWVWVIEFKRVTSQEQAA